MANLNWSVRVIATDIHVFVEGLRCLMVFPWIIHALFNQHLAFDYHVTFDIGMTSWVY